MSRRAAHGRRRAGVWIGQAADVLAMAPSTNIGSSTPIDSSGGEHRQRPASARSSTTRPRRSAPRARARRNTKWADLAVAKASNLTARQALSMNVIDADRADPAGAARAARGLQDEGRSGRSTLHLAGAQITNVSHGFFTRLLEHAHRPEPALAALPRGHRRHRLRGLPPGRRPARRARRGRRS